MKRVLGVLLHPWFGHIKSTQNWLWAVLKAGSVVVGTCGLARGVMCTCNTILTLVYPQIRIPALFYTNMLSFHFSHMSSQTQVSDESLIFRNVLDSV